jgi:TonB family protein
MRVLLVDHDSEGLETISRAIRGVLEIDCVSSKGDAMLLLRQNTYDVLIACERCVDGSGLDLLGRTTRTTTPLKRIFSAPPERLQLLGPRLAPFKVQRTINYPIDLEELWLAIAQVTGTNDETDGTVERAVLDERGIPSSGTSPRSPIPPRPPAPLREVRATAPASGPAPAVAAAAAGGRAAAARMAQPTPEPALRAPPPPRQPPPMRAPAPPASSSDTGRMRAAALATSDTGRMRALHAAPPARVESGWTPEPVDDFAQVAEQARLGVQRKVVDEAARRKKQRLITAGAIAAVVAAVIVVLIEKYYDPEARAREKAIAAEVTRMAEQQKVTDNLTLIEVDIEKAIMDNDLALARQELARLVAESPEHPRREFLQASIDRAAELARLAAQRGADDDSGSAEPQAPPRARAPERPAAQRETTRAPRDTARDRTQERAPAERAPARQAAANNTRSFGAPVGETPAQRTIPLNAPINSEPVLASQRQASSFGGRTVEASDSGSNYSAAPTASLPSNPNAAGSAVVNTAPVPAPAPAVPAATNITPAKILKRVAPVPPVSIAARSGGYVVISYTVTADGRVSDLSVVESSPNGVFDGAAQAAVRKWLYEPRKENGVAVASSARARLVFEPIN